MPPARHSRAPAFPARPQLDVAVLPPPLRPTRDGKPTPLATIRRPARQPAVRTTRLQPSDGGESVAPRTQPWTDVSAKEDLREGAADPLKGRIRTYGGRSGARPL